MILSEVFKPIESNYGTDENVSDGKFKTINFGLKVHYSFIDYGKNRYMVSFTDVGEKTFDVGFSAKSIGEATVNIEDYLDMTPTGSYQAMKAFGVIAYIMLQFVRQFEVDALRFAGSGDKHDKAYKMLASSNSVKKFSEKSGFNYDGIHEIPVFGMTKNYHFFRRRQQ